MKKDTGSTLMKQLGLAARSIGFFPVIILASYAYSRTYDLHLFWIQLAGILGAGCLGCCQAVFRERLQRFSNHRSGLYKVILGISYIAVCVAFWLLSGYMVPVNALIRVVFFILSLVIWVMNMKDYRLHYSSILSLEMIVVITVIYTVAVVLSKYEILGLLYILIIGTYILIGNQLKIEELLQRTQKNTPLFNHIRRENARRVCLMVSCIFIGYPFKGIIVKGIKWMFMKVVWVLLTIIIFLISLLPVSEGSGVTSEAVSGMGELPGAERNELLNFILWLVVIGVGILVIYKYRESILASVKDTLRRIKLSFNKVYSFLFGNRQHELINPSDYEEHIEEITKGEIEKAVPKYHNNKRQWKRQVKKYLKQSVEAEQLREGYRLILQGAKLYGTDIKQSYTAREIEKQIERQINLNSLGSRTVAYEEIRYGGCGEQVEQLEQIRETLEQLLNLDK